MSRPEVNGRIRLPRDFYLLLTSQGTSLVGSDMQQIALPLWVYQQTGSALSAGLAFALQFIPIVLLAPWVGTIADRFDRRRLMITCELAAAAFVAMALVGVALSLLPMVLVFSSLTRMLNAITMPAMQAVIVSIVPQEHRARSASLSTIVFACVQVAAPLAGTALAGTLGFSFVLIFDLISFLVSALLLTPLAPCPGVAGLRNAARATWQAFRDHASPLLRWTVSTEAIYFLLWGADAALALLILEDRFGPAQAGVYATAAGVGWVLASTLIAARFKQHPLRLLAVGAFCGPVGAIGFVLLVPFGLVASFLPGVLVGIGNLAVITGATTIFQQQATAEVAGRLFAVRRAVLNAALSASYLLLPGVSAAGLGHGPTMIVFSLLMLIAVLPMTALTAQRETAAEAVGRV